MNPELTYTVSPYLTAVGVVDILMHTLERYFQPEHDAETDASDRGIPDAVHDCGRQDGHAGSKGL